MAFLFLEDLRRFVVSFLLSDSLSSSPESQSLLSFSPEVELWLSESASETIGTSSQWGLGGLSFVDVGILALTVPPESVKTLSESLAESAIFCSIALS